MFGKLHRNMTLFCTFVTGLILIAMTVLCLFLSQQAMRETLHQVFLRDVSSTIFHLEGQPVITSQWLGDIEDGRYFISLYDNRQPLLHNGLISPSQRTEREKVFQLAADTAMRSYHLNITDPPEHLRSALWDDFLMHDQQGRSYFAAAAVLPRSSGSLGAVLLMPLWDQDRQFAAQWMLFAGIDLVGVLALLIFGWFFTGRMLHPLRENREKQVQFVAAASHELRSPLAVMLSNLSALDKAPPDRRAQFQEGIHTECTRMARLVDDLLALSSADSSRSWSILTSPTHLDTLALNLYELYQGPAQEKGIRLTVTLPDEGMPPVQCDGQRVEQAITALINNALSYTSSDGQVDIILDRLPGGLGSSGRVMFTIRDNGPGIPDSEKRNIFERFYRVDSSRSDREHFGLGLSVALEIARLHRGKLWVEDTPGGGASFKLVI